MDGLDSKEWKSVVLPKIYEEKMQKLEAELEKKVSLSSNVPEVLIYSYILNIFVLIRSAIRQSTCYNFPFKSVERRCLLYPVIQKTLSIPSLSILIPFSVDNGVALSVNVGSSVGIILPSTSPPISCLNSTDKVSGEKGREEGK